MVRGGPLVGTLWQRYGGKCHALAENPAKAENRKSGIPRIFGVFASPFQAPIDYYNVACGHAILAGIGTIPGSGMSAVEGQAEAERAMQWLHRAVARGYRNAALMQRDHDLDPLRSRDDFRLLMMDLAMPDDPFSKGTDADR
jgi:hypothetical protein